MRWIYHVTLSDPPPEGPYAPESLAREGFVHGSYRERVAESARLYFPPDAELRVLQIDPRRLPAPVVVADTPRGPMPHIHGPIPRDAIRSVLDVGAVATAPDDVQGTRFGFVAFEGMTLLDLVGVHDPISRIASMGFDATSSCAVVSALAPRVWSADGVEVTCAEVRPSLGAFDVLVVPGGPGAGALAKDPDVLAWLATFPKNRLAVSVCTGALLLGAAGRLEGKRATTHQSALGSLAAYGATAVEGRVVDEGQLVTGGGVTSGIDVGLHVVLRIAGAEVAAKIRAQMEYRG